MRATILATIIGIFRPIHFQPPPISTLFTLGTARQRLPYDDSGRRRH